jgi:hypothetical protein
LYNSKDNFLVPPAVIILRVSSDLAPFPKFLYFLLRLTADFVPDT